MMPCKAAGPFLRLMDLDGVFLSVDLFLLFRLIKMTEPILVFSRFSVAQHWVSGMIALV